MKVEAVTKEIFGVYHGDKRQETRTDIYEGQIIEFFKLKDFLVLRIDLLAQVRIPLDDIISVKFLEF